MRYGIVPFVMSVAVGGAAAQTWPPELEWRLIPGLAAGDNFATAAALVGDVNGDGRPDWAVGAPYADPAGSASGAVYVFFGGPGLPGPAPNLVLTGEAPDDHFGISVAGGDLDGDGYADIIVGARFNDRGARDGGAVFIFRGGPNPSATPALVLVAEAADDWFGQSVAFAGDVNGDGFGDVVIGAPYNDASANAAGRAYLYFGGSPLPPGGMLALPGPAQAHAHFGWSVAGPGDVNGDGRADVLVGARLFGSGPNRARGRAYLYLGGSPMGTVAARTYDGAAPDDWFGQCVAGVGDVNGDGRADFAVGAVYNDAGGSAAGSASVYFGGASLPGAAALVVLGPHPDAQAGWSIGGGRLDEDPFAEVLVGARMADGPGRRAAGAILVIRGAASPNPNPLYTLTGAAAGDHLGESVTGIGAGTFLAGANYSSVGGTGSGAAWAIRLARCLVDLNGDGVVDFNDLLEFLNLYNAGDPRADFNGDGVIDFNDFLEFLNLYNVGC